MYEEILYYLFSLKKILFPSKNLNESTFIVCYLAANYLMTEFDRDHLPDWVAVLAGASLDNWKASYEEVLNEFLLK